MEQKFEKCGMNIQFLDGQKYVDYDGKELYIRDKCFYEFSLATIKNREKIE